MRPESSPAPRSQTEEEEGTSLWARVRAWVPQGGSLPADQWASRHRVLVSLAWVHVPLLFLFGIFGGRDTWISYAVFEPFGTFHSFYEAGIVGVFAALASWPRLSRRVRSVAASFALVSASAILTHLSGGFIEAHFHFFVMIGVIAAYQDYAPFLLAIAYVAVHHGVAGSIDPSSVYNHPSAVLHPWRWAGIHAFFIAGLSAAELFHWRATERARAETEAHAENLEQALSLQGATLESTADGILVVDRAGRITAYNERFRELWGIPPEVLDARDDEAAIGYVLDQLEDPEAFLAKVHELYDTPSAESVDEIRFQDGRVFERLSRPQRHEQEVVGRVWSFRDVTETRRNHQQLEERAEALARSNEELERFAYICSHDLQEPLRMVASYVQLLERRYAESLDEDAHAYIRFAHEGATRAHQLVNGLLAYSRVDREGDALTSTDLQEVLDAVLQDLQIGLEEADVTVTHDALPVVTGDPIQLAQVLQNLLSNAVKFQKDAPGTVHVSAKREAGHWRFGVHDEGIGIEPDFHDEVFVIFRRLNDRARYPGTGVGLAICRRIVERHGGRIWVESEPGHGASFYFTVPDSHDEESTARSPGTTLRAPSAGSGPSQDARRSAPERTGDIR